MKLLLDRRKFLVVDGNLQITVNKTGCSCHQPWCTHLKLVLSSLDPKVEHYWDYCRTPGLQEQLKPVVSQILAARTANSLLTELVEDYLAQHECAICLEELIKQALWQCPQCRNLAHQSCMTKWQVQRASCPLCVADNLDQYQQFLKRAMDRSPL